MLDFILIPSVIGIITFGIYKLFELFACRRERLAIIDKLGEKFTGVDFSGKFSLPGYGKSSFSFSALKAGSLMLGIGLGLLIGFLISYYLLPDYAIRKNYQTTEAAAIIYGSCTLLFGGLGLVSAFIIEMKINKAEKN